MAQTQQVTFNDGTKLQVVYCKRDKVFFDNAQRDSVELQFDRSVIAVDTLEALIKDADSLLLETQEGDTEVSFVLQNHTLCVNIGYKPIKIKDETDTEPAEYESRTYVVLARKTYDQIQADNLKKDIDNLQNTVDALVIAGLEG